MGVGNHFDEQMGGASLIAELKKNYPSKLVIAYSGAPRGAQITRAAIDAADGFVKKDIPTAEWADLLDGYVDKSLDPCFHWTLIRARLFELELDIKDVLRLEDGYVRSIERRDTQFKKLEVAANDLSLQGDVRGVIQSLIASTVFALVTGA